MLIALWLALACKSAPTQPTPVAVAPVLPPAAPAVAAPSAPPDLVLVTVEGLRADAIRASETPWLAALAAAGASFSGARATSSWALPSTVSALTGLYPCQHTVTRGRIQGGAAVDQVPLPASALTLAERLAAAGYRTQGVSNSPALATGTGVEQGFETLVSVAEPDAAALAAAVAALPEVGEAPRFLWLHVRDLGVGWEPWQPASGPLDARGLLRDRYRQELAHVDAALASALAGVGEDAVIAVAGTHGVELGEHGQVGDQRSLTEVALRVPLILRAPDARGEIAGPVSLVDLAPTLVQLATGSAPAAPEVSGTSLLPALRGAPLPARSLPAEVNLDARLGMFAIASGADKVVRIDGPGESGARVAWALGADGQERAAAVDAPAAIALQDALDAWLREARRLE